MSAPRRERVLVNGVFAGHMESFTPDEEQRIGDERGNPAVARDRAIVRKAREVPAVAAALDGRSVLVIRPWNQDDLVDLITPRLHGAEAASLARTGVPLFRYTRRRHGGPLSVLGVARVAPGERVWRHALARNSSDLWCASPARDGEAGDFWSGPVKPEALYSEALWDLLILWEVEPSADIVETMWSLRLELTLEADLRGDDPRVEAGRALSDLIARGASQEDPRIVGLIAMAADGDGSARAYFEALVAAWPSPQTTETTAARSTP